jgi:hypothetical protein
LTGPNRHVLFGGGDKAHSLPVAAIEGETLSPLSQPSSKLLVIDTTLLLPLVEVGEHTWRQSGPADTLSLPNAPHLPQAPWQLRVSPKLRAASLPLAKVLFNRNPGATWPTVECAQCFDAIRCLFILGKDF